MKGKLNTGTAIQNIAKLVIGAFAIFIIIISSVENDPQFGRYGWLILGALIIGITVYVRHIIHS